MNTKFYDVVVAKEYISKNNGKEELKTAWNKVGRSWISQSGDSLSFELFMLPNLRYVVQLNDKNRTPQNKSTQEATL